MKRVYVLYHSACGADTPAAQKIFADCTRRVYRARPRGARELRGPRSGGGGFTPRTPRAARDRSRPPGRPAPACLDAVAGRYQRLPGRPATHPPRLRARPSSRPRRRASALRTSPQLRRCADALSCSRILLSHRYLLTDGSGSMAFASPTARSCAAAHKRAARLPPRSSARRAAARTGQAAQSARGFGVRARASSESKEAEATAGGLRGAVRYLLEAAWEIFSVPDDKGVKFTLQPYSGTPLSKDDRRRIDRMAGAVRSAAAYGLVASTSDSEADPPAPSDSGEAGEITQDFGKHGEQTVANTSPIGVVASAVRAVAGRFKVFHDAREEA